MYLLLIAIRISVFTWKSWCCTKRNSFFLTEILSVPFPLHFSFVAHVKSAILKTATRTSLKRTVPKIQFKQFFDMTGERRSCLNVETCYGSRFNTFWDKGFTIISGCVLRISMCCSITSAEFWILFHVFSTDQCALFLRWDSSGWNDIAARLLLSDGNTRIGGMSWICCFKHNSE